MDELSLLDKLNQENQIVKKSLAHMHESQDFSLKALQEFAKSLDTALDAVDYLMGEIELLKRRIEELEDRSRLI